VRESKTGKGLAVTHKGERPAARDIDNRERDKRPKSHKRYYPQRKVRLTLLLPTAGAPIILSGRERPAAHSIGT
jgi:hypothetical protein